MGNRPPARARPASAGKQGMVTRRFSAFRGCFGAKKCDVNSLNFNRSISFYIIPATRIWYMKLKRCWCKLYINNQSFVESSLVLMFVTASTRAAICSSILTTFSCSSLFCTMILSWVSKFASVATLPLHSWNLSLQLGIDIWYRVTHHAGPNLSLTSKQKFRISMRHMY